MCEESGEAALSEPLSLASPGSGYDVLCTQSWCRGVVIVWLWVVGTLRAGLVVCSRTREEVVRHLVAGAQPCESGCWAAISAWKLVNTASGRERLGGVVCQLQEVELEDEEFMVVCLGCAERA